MEQGILDLLDKADLLLGGIDVSQADAKSMRKIKSQVLNARGAIQEARRRIEREVQTTPT